MNAWILGWLGIGFAVLAAVVIDRFRRDGEFERFHVSVNEGIFGPPSAKDLAIDILATAIGFALVVLAGPLVPVARIVHAWRNRWPGVPVPRIKHPPFAVAAGDLLAVANRAVIEAAETVHDPLHAAPELPFGHLNPAWRAFADALPPDAVLHAFRSDWRNQYGSVERHEGYVAVVAGVPGAYFLTRVPRPVASRE